MSIEPWGKLFFEIGLESSYVVVSLPCSSGFVELFESTFMGILMFVGCGVVVFKHLSFFRFKVFFYINNKIIKPCIDLFLFLFEYEFMQIIEDFNLFVVERIYRKKIFKIELAHEHNAKIKNTIVLLKHSFVYFSKI